MNKFICKLHEYKNNDFLFYFNYIKDHFYRIKITSPKEEDGLYFLVTITLKFNVYLLDLNIELLCSLNSDQEYFFEIPWIQNYNSTIFTYLSLEDQKILKYIREDFVNNQDLNSRDFVIKILKEFKPSFKLKNLNEYQMNNALSSITSNERVQDALNSLIYENLKSLEEIENTKILTSLKMIYDEGSILCYINKKEIPDTPYFQVVGLHLGNIRFHPNSGLFVDSYIVTSFLHHDATLKQKQLIAKLILDLKETL